MGNLTERLMKFASEDSTANNLVQDALEEVLHGDGKEAGEKIAELSDEQMEELRAELSKHGQGPEMETHGTTENPKAEVRKTVPEEKARTEARPAKEDEDIKLGKGLGPGDGGESAPTPTISSLLSPPIKETERTPEGGGDTASDLKKKAEFEAGWIDGIKQGVKGLTGLVAKHASLNIRERFGDAFDKIASKVGGEEATTVLLEGFTEGQKLAMKELESKKEVKMGSLKKLAEDQEKIASVEDLREYGQKLGREALLTKIAEDQAKTAQDLVEEAAVEPVVEEPAVEDAEIAEAVEASQIVGEIVQKAMTEPGSLTPEEAEVLLAVEDAVEDAEAEYVGGEEKVTSVLDIAAALRQNGYGE